MISINKPETSGNWDSHLKSFRYSLFITRAWLSSVNASELRPVYFDFLDEGVCVGKIAGFEISFRRASYKQLIFYAGPATAEGSDEDIITGCIGELYRYAHENGYLRLIIKSYDYFGNLLPGPEKMDSRQRMEYVIDLNDSEDEIFRRFDPDVRRRVRNARKKGAVLQKSFSPGNIDRLMMLVYSTRIIREGKGYSHYESMYIPFLDAETIRTMLIKKNAAIFYVQQNDEVIGSQLVFMHQDKSYAILMGIDTTGYKMNVPAFLFCEIALEMKRDGMSYYNIGGVPAGASHTGVRDYKEKLGAAKIHSTEHETGFLSFPMKLMNPLLRIQKRASDNQYGRLAKRVARKSIKVLSGEKEILL